jgi:hypothetical protein
MSEHTMNLIKNQTYEWKEILTGLDAVAGPVYYVLHYKGTDKVAAACLRIDKNPRAPYEIIPKNGPFIVQWADNFSAQPEAVPVFVQELDGNWYYRGRFKVTGQSSDPNEIRLREQQASRTNVYKILFLQEAQQ